MFAVWQRPVVGRSLYLQFTKVFSLDLGAATFTAIKFISLHSGWKREEAEASLTCGFC